MISTKVLPLFVSVTFLKKSFTMLQWRNNSYVCKKLVFEEFGDPAKVLKLQEETVPDLKNREVLIKFLLASINPADINYIQGVYPLKPEFPAIGGYECVGDVIKIGPGVRSLRPGDRIISNAEMIGTWRTFGAVDEYKVLKVPKDIDPVSVAGISSNPCTAYRMLKDFVKLDNGDAIIQNAANSACGQNVIQLSKNWGYKSINIIRDRPEVEQLKEYLISLGADFVFTEEELRQTHIFKDKKCPKPKLALNAVGGRSATEIARQLDTGGVLVTYGGMAKEPVSIPVSTFIFKNLTCKGFWMTGWTQNNRESYDRKQMLDDLLHLMRANKLLPPKHKLIPITAFAEAFETTTTSKGFIGHKYILDLQS